MAHPKLKKCHRGHPFNEANTYLYKKKKYCRKCRAIESKEVRLRAKGELKMPAKKKAKGRAQAGCEKEKGLRSLPKLRRNKKFRGGRLVVLTPTADVR